MSGRGRYRHPCNMLTGDARRGGPCRHTPLLSSRGSAYSTVGYTVLRKLSGFAGTAFNYLFAFPQNGVLVDFPGTAEIAYPAGPARSPPVSEHWHYRKHCFYNRSVLRRATSAPTFSVVCVRTFRHQMLSLGGPHKLVHYRVYSCRLRVPIMTFLIQPSLDSEQVFSH